MEQVSILFDSDTLNDFALIVENTNEFSKFKLLIYLTSLKKQFEVDLINTTEFQIYPVQINTKKNVIEFGYFQDGTSTFGRFIKLRYNAKVKNIQVIGYDSSYKNSMTDLVNKSYNLLTGKYTVKRTKLEIDSTEKVEEFTGKNTYFQNKIFINDLTESIIINLDDVGSRYE
jgi:ribosomal protein L20A (L18A)